MFESLEHERIGDHILFLADARDVIDHVDFDVLCADPPYGVNGGSGAINKKNGKSKYHADFPDTEEYINTVCVDIVNRSLDRCIRGAITPGGKCSKYYRFPDCIGGYYQPAGTGMCEWGSVNFQPIFYYGRDPRLGKRIIPIVRQMNEHAPKNIHPCPKPENPWTWLVHKVSLEDEVVFDPFMGTGTTGLSCQKLGRKFIGVEMDRKYFDLACSKLENVVSQGSLFSEGEPAPKIKTGKLI